MAVGTDNNSRSMRPAVLVLLLAGAFGAVWWQTQNAAAPASAPAAAPARPPKVLEPPAVVEVAPPSSAPATFPPLAANPEPAPVAEDDSGDIPEFQVDSRDAFYEMLAALGLDNAQEAMAQWSKDHGYASIDMTGQLQRDQPYDRYDEATLGQLSADGDMWATQELAARLSRERPAEAVELYQRAAAQGSLYAMDELARLYRMAGSEAVARSRVFEAARPQIEAIRASGADPNATAYAWLVAAEMASGDPSRTAATARQLARQLEPEQIEQACAMAPSLLESLDTMRANEGIAAPGSQIPPMVIAPGGLTEASECYDPAVGVAQFEGCREARFTSGAMTNTVWVCDHD
jgi:hypothetical protein